MRVDNNQNYRYITCESNDNVAVLQLPLDQHLGILRNTAEMCAHSKLLRSLHTVCVHPVHPIVCDSCQKCTSNRDISVFGCCAQAGARYLVTLHCDFGIYYI